MKGKPSVMVTRLFVAVMLLAGGPAYAAQAGGGVIVCGGNHFERSTEEHVGFYTIRNIDLSGSMQIQSVVVVDAGGAIRFDGLPGDVATRNPLPPLNTVQFSTHDVLDAFLSQAERPITVGIIWKAAGAPSINQPMAGWVHTVRETGGGAERSRMAVRCAVLE